MNNRHLMIVVIMMVAFIFLPGCSDKNKNNEASKPNLESAQVPPQELKSLLDGIENIITELVSLIAMDNLVAGQLKIAAPVQHSIDQEKKDQADSNLSIESRQEDAETQNKTKDKEKTIDTADQQKKIWHNIMAKLKDVHKDWNKIEFSAIKAGLSVAERNSFETALDNLTLDISEQKKLNALRNTVELYGQYASLAKAFKSEIPAEYYKTKYEIMASGVEALEGNWNQALNRLPNLEENWNSFKVKSKLKNESLLSCSDLSVDDYVSALNSNNIDVLIIKAEIVLANLGQIEKQLSQPGGNQ